MERFLCFRLYGPMAAWGDIAIGERRSATEHPSRSGVLGLLAAALGLRREDADRLSELDAALGFASSVVRRGELLVDYHTAQAPDEVEVRAALKRRSQLPTRRTELAIKKTRDAAQSWRAYFLDSVSTGCVWRSAASSGWSLEMLADALRAPRFIPYLGRKSCPLALPLEPAVIEAQDPVRALKTASFKGDALLGLSQVSGPVTFYWEGSWPELAAAKTTQRRDRLRSRTRWQFVEREEHSLMERSHDVSEST